MKSSGQGFTLVELLVAMTVLAFLTVLLFGSLRFGARAWERGSSNSSGMQEVRQVQGVLRRELEQAYPLYDASGARRIAFSGDAAGVHLLAPAPRALIGAGLARIAFERRRNGTTFDLVMRAAPELAAGGDGAFEQALMRNLAAVRFSYFGAETAGAAPVWRDRWAAPLAMPQLVRVEVQFPKGDSRAWPQLAVAPHILVDADCVYDVAQRGCRDRR